MVHNIIPSNANLFKEKISWNKWCVRYGLRGRDTRTYLVQMQMGEKTVELFKSVSYCCRFGVASFREVYWRVVV